MLGDGVWEGLRLHRGVMLHARTHVRRLFEGAKALDMHLAISAEELIAEVYRVCDANSMTDDVHIRLMATRGLKPTPYQHPKITLGDPTIVIIPEYKASSEETKRKGLTLFTVHVRRPPADVQDPMWNSHSKLNCIAACIQAAKAGADEALMLDPHGFVATCNSTNFFVVRDGEVWAPTTKYQLHGITRQHIIDLCHEVCASSRPISALNCMKAATDSSFVSDGQNGIPCVEKDFSLTEVYSADEVFVTGTMAGQIPVRSVDGRTIGNGERGPMTQRLQGIYRKAIDQIANEGR